MARFFLAVGDAGDASPIRSFEVTPETLAQAAGLFGGGGPEEALASFKASVCGGGMRSAIEDGLYPSGIAPKEAPGCLAYLTLTLLVASMPDAAKKIGGEFREKLRDFVGGTRGYGNIPGVAFMWRSLQTWLDQRRAEGLPFRELVLPIIPLSWVQTGYTLRLAFPTKPDATLLKKFLLTHPDLLDDARRLVREFAPVIESGRCSDGMREAFKDFGEAVNGDDAFLADHAFWRLARSCSPRLREREEEMAIECAFDEDGDPNFYVLRAGSKLDLGAMHLSAAVKAMGSAGAAHAPTLLRGFLIFRQAGYGRWRSVEALDGSPGMVRIGCSASAHRLLHEHRRAFAADGEWFFTSEPVGAAVADDVARLLGEDGLATNRIVAVAVSGGVKTAGLWLGRPSFLPRIRAGDGEIGTRPGPGAEGTLTAVLDPGIPGTARFRAPGPVSGPWFVDPVNRGRSWSRRVSFASDAHVHGPFDAPAYSYEELKDWLGGQVEIPRCETSPDGWHAGDRRIGDLVEAVYAGGRSGWDEPDLIGLVQEALYGEENPWAVIRSLRDATIIQPRLRPRWKGRVWTLRPPSLRRIGQMMIADGAICERMAAEFRSVMSALGGETFRSGGASPFAPTLIGCRGGDLLEGSRRLGWPVTVSGVCGDASKMFVETSLRLLGREQASRWDWEGARFTTDPNTGEGPVRLARWTQPGGADHDIYTVEQSGSGRQFRLLSRGAAIAMAYCAAAVPLFKASGGFLVGLAREACLPDLIAARLRLRHASNPGPLGGSYVFAADAADLAWLEKVLPGLVVRDNNEHRMTSVDAVSSSRHSRGRIRLAWSGGSLSTYSVTRAPLRSGSG